MRISKTGREKNYRRFILKISGNDADDICLLRPEDVEAINNALNVVLGTRLKEIIKMRFGLNPDGAIWTLQKVANLSGVSEERIRQLIARAIRILRHSNKFEAATNTLFRSFLIGRIKSLGEKIQNLRVVITKLDAAADKVKLSFLAESPQLANSINEYEHGLSVRVRNALSDCGIRTIYDLAVKTENQLMSKKGIGQKGLGEIKEFLAEHGLHTGLSMAYISKD